MDDDIDAILDKFIANFPSELARLEVDIAFAEAHGDRELADRHRRNLAYLRLQYDAVTQMKKQRTSS